MSIIIVPERTGVRFRCDYHYCYDDDDAIQVLIISVSPSADIMRMITVMMATQIIIIIITSQNHRIMNDYIIHMVILYL